MLDQNLCLQELNNEEMMEVNGGEPITVVSGLIILGCAVAGWLLGRRAARKKAAEK